MAAEGIAYRFTSGILRCHLGPGRDVHVRELVQTHFDTLDGHWAWWVRLEGHFADLDPAARSLCFEEIRQALQALQTDAGIPYTTRILRVSTRPHGAEA